jgi:hypothetical protein
VLNINGMTLYRSQEYRLRCHPYLGTFYPEINI